MIRIENGEIKVVGMSIEILTDLLTLISSKSLLELIEPFMLDGQDDEFKELLKKVYNVGKEINNFCKLV